jgi:2'-deoxynucleoside 5'-phosphate N-hydrolase
MKIYFAGSIHGGSPDRDLYQKIVGYLHQFGEVLTEHVGDVERSTKREGSQTVQEIYDEDMHWLRQSDVVVAEVTTPSLGVGYEIARAEELGKPILCLYRPLPDRILSLMLKGNKKLKVAEFHTLDEVKAHINDFFSQSQKV